MPWVMALKRTAALPAGVMGPRERRPLAALVRARRSVRAGLVWSGVGWSVMVGASCAMGKARPGPRGVGLRGPGEADLPLFSTDPSGGANHDTLAEKWPFV